MLEWIYNGMAIGPMNAFGWYVCVEWIYLGGVKMRMRLNRKRVLQYISHSVRNTVVDKNVPRLTILTVSAPTRSNLVSNLAPYKH